MITLTDTDVVRLLRKNNLNSDTLQENVVAKLREKGIKLATAESCTGGLLSERITAVSGASDVFDFGVCTYANEMKHKVLGVSNCLHERGCEALTYESVYATAMLCSGIICCVLHKLSSRTKIIGFVHNNG